MYRKFIFVAAALSAAAFGVGQSITFNTTGLGGSATIDFSPRPSLTNVFAGKLNFSDATNFFGLGTSLQTVCVDLRNSIHAGSTYATSLLLSNAVGDTGLEYAGRIVDKYFAAADTNTKAKQLQLAVWEAVYDGAANGATPDFASGIFESTSATSLASTYYSAITSNVGGVAYYFLPADGTHGQAQMTLVPEPATMATLAVGALALLRRRKK